MALDEMEITKATSRHPAFQSLKEGDTPSLTIPAYRKRMSESSASEKG